MKASSNFKLYFSVAIKVSNSIFSLTQELIWASASTTFSLILLEKAYPTATHLSFLVEYFLF